MTRQNAGQGLSGRPRDRLAHHLLGVSRADLERLAEQVKELRRLLERRPEDESVLAGHHPEFQEALRDAQRDLEIIGGRLSGLAEGVSQQQERLGRLELHARVAPTMVWLEHTDVPEELLVSVVLATRDRAGLLSRAIESVLAQRYRRWELVVVDDGSTDRTKEVLSSLDDSRIRVERADGSGSAAARNTGLGLATGSVIVYLDDDNVMHPLWLRGVAWGFSRSPEVAVAYGARIVDDPESLGLGPGLHAPLHFEPFERERLRAGNFIDLGVLAHRAGLPEARFDRRFPTLGDWDFVLRLTSARSAVPLPVVALLYSTSAPGRLSDRPGKEAEVQLIRDRFEDRSVKRP